MRNILIPVSLLCCVVAMIFPATGLPINDGLRMSKSADLESRILKKRSTNADIGLHGSRSSRVQELVRQYMLLTLLENVKGKRSWNPKKFPTKHDGTLDYERIAGVVLKKQRRRKPWYVVDMKRDIHSTEQDPELEYVYDVNAGIPSMLEDNGDITQRDEFRDVPHQSDELKLDADETDFPFFLMQSLNGKEDDKVPSNMSPQYTELVADEENGNSEDDLLKFLTA